MSAQTTSTRRSKRPAVITTYSTSSSSPTASATLRTSPVTDTATMACTANPRVAGSVTATTCITPRSMRRCTRCRTAACDRPTAGPSFEYGVRPSSWRARMIALSVSSSSRAPAI